MILVDTLSDMSYKNRINSSDPHHDKKSSNSRRINFTAITGMIAGVFCSNLGYNQQDVRIPNDLKKKNNISLIEKDSIVPVITTNNTTKDTTDSIDYEQVKKSPISILEKRYGKEKTLDIIQKCLLIEVNKIRKEFWLDTLVLNENLIKAAQLHAEEVSKNKYSSHYSKNWDDWVKRAKKSWYTWTEVDEDMWWNYYSIQDAIKERRKSIPHFEAIKNPKRKDLWPGYSNDYRVLMFGK